MRKILLLASIFAYSTCLFAKVKNCSINSEKYSQVARVGLEVPIVDGAVFRIQQSESIVKSVTIQGESFFKKCNPELVTIDGLDIAKKILKYTGETDYTSFVGTSIFNCVTTNDEGYLFIRGDKESYLGYLGQYDLPVSVVALDCKQ